MVAKQSEAIVKEMAVLLADLFQDDIPSFFMPYIAFLVDEKSYADIDIEIISKDFYHTFGIPMDAMVLERLCNEAIAREYIYNSQGRYCSNPLKIGTLQFEKDCKAALSRYQELKTAYNKFVVEKNGLSALEDDKLDDVVMELIQNVSIDTKEHSKEADNMNAHEMVLNDFLLYAEKEHPEIVEVLNQFAVSDSLWNVIANEHEPRPYFPNGIKIFLDTKCIFRLIGLEGEYWQQVFQNFVATLKECDAEVVVFEHVLQEINRIIQNARKVYKAPDFDMSRASAVACHFRYEGYNDARIDRILYNLNNNPCLTYDFAIESCDYEDSDDQFQIDYANFKKILTETYQESNPSFDPELKDQTIETDIRSITMSYRLRAGSRPRQISDANVLFITTNSSLAQAAKKYERIQNKESGGSISVCWTANYLSTLIWLGMPKSYIKISKQKLLAYCYAAAKPTKEQIETYFQTINQLRKEGKCSAEELQYLKESRTLLRQYTLASATAPTGSKPSFIDSLENFKKQTLDKIQKLEGEVSGYKEAEGKRKTESEQFQKKAEDYANRKLEWVEHKFLPFLPAVVAFFIALISLLFVPSAFVKGLLSAGSGLLGILFVALGMWVKEKSGHAKLHSWLKKHYAKKHVEKIPGWNED